MKDTEIAVVVQEMRWEPTLDNVNRSYHRNNNKNYISTQTNIEHFWCNIRHSALDAPKILYF